MTLNPMNKMNHIITRSKSTKANAERTNNSKSCRDNFCHDNCSEDPVTCNVCHKVFMNQANFAMHQRTHYNNNINRENTDGVQNKIQNNTSAMQGKTSNTNYHTHIPKVEKVQSKVQNTTSVNADTNTKCYIPTIKKPKFTYEFEAVNMADGQYSIQQGQSSSTLETHGTMVKQDGSIVNQLPKPMTRSRKVKRDKKSMMSNGANKVGQSMKANKTEQKRIIPQSGLQIDKQRGSRITEKSPSKCDGTVLAKSRKSNGANKIMVGQSKNENKARQGRMVSRLGLKIQKARGRPRKMSPDKKPIILAKGSRDKTVCRYCKKKLSSISNCQRHERRHTEIDGRGNSVPVTRKPVDLHKKSAVYIAKNIPSTDDVNEDNSVQRENRSSDQVLSDLHKRPSIICQFCTQKFSTQENCQKHEELHKPKTYEDKSARRKKASITRSTIHVLDDVQKSSAIACQFCKMKFSTRKSCQKHEDLHKLKPYGCKLCSVAFADIEYLRQHVMRMHKEVIPQQPVMEPFQELAELNSDFPWQANGKSYEFQAGSTIEVSSSNETIQKTQPAKEYRSKVENSSHRKIAQRDEIQDLWFKTCVKYECTKCELTCESQGLLDSHEKEAHDRDLCICQYCNKRFSRTSCRVLHERLHTNINPYNCKLCLKVFPNTTYLIRHFKKEHPSKGDDKIDNVSRMNSGDDNILCHQANGTGDSMGDGGRQRSSEQVGASSEIINQSFGIVENVDLAFSTGPRPQQGMQESMQQQSSIYRRTSKRKRPDCQEYTADSQELIDGGRGNNISTRKSFNLEVNNFLADTSENNTGRRKYSSTEHFDTFQSDEIEDMGLHVAVGSQREYLVKTRRNGSREEAAGSFSSKIDPQENSSIFGLTCDNSYELISNRTEDVELEVIDREDMDIAKEYQTEHTETRQKKGIDVKACRARSQQKNHHEYISAVCYKVKEVGLAMECPAAYEEPEQKTGTDDKAGFLRSHQKSHHEGITNAVREKVKKVKKPTSAIQKQDKDKNVDLSDDSQVKKETMNSVQNFGPIKRSNNKRSPTSKKRSIQVARIEKQQIKTNLAKKSAQGSKYKPSKCSFCGKHFTRHNNCIRHEQSVHLKVKGNLSELKNHKRKHITAKQKGDTSKLKIKKQTVRETSNKNEKQSKMEKVKTQRTVKKEKNISRSLGHKQSKQYGKCGYCGKLFSRESTARIHEKTVHLNLKLFKCDKCGALFKWPDSMQKHKRKLHALKDGASPKERSKDGVGKNTDSSLITEGKNAMLSNQPKVILSREYQAFSCLNKNIGESGVEKIGIQQQNKDVGTNCDAPLTIDKRIIGFSKEDDTQNQSDINTEMTSLKIIDESHDNIGIKTSDINTNKSQSCQDHNLLDISSIPNTQAYVNISTSLSFDDHSNNSSTLLSPPNTNLQSSREYSYSQQHQDEVISNHLKTTTRLSDLKKIQSVKKSGGGMNQRKSSLWVCDQCDMEFVGKKHLIYHQRSEHSGDLEMQRKGRASSSCCDLYFEAVCTPDGYFKCSMCPATFTQERQLRSHEFVHSRNKEQSLGCPQCGTEFKRRKEWVGHMNCHNMVPFYECKYCEKSFRVIKNWWVHENGHENTATRTN